MSPIARLPRQLWFKQATAALADTDLIFLGPDNGIEVPSVAKDKRKSSKYAYRDELSAAYRAGRSLLFHQHYHHEERESFIRNVADDLQRVAADAEIWAIRTSHAVFMLERSRAKWAPVRVEKMR